MHSRTSFFSCEKLVPSWSQLYSVQVSRASFLDGELGSSVMGFRPEIARQQVTPTRFCRYSRQLDDVTVQAGACDSLPHNLQIFIFVSLKNDSFVRIAARMLYYTISAMQDSAYNITQIII